MQTLSFKARYKGGLIEATISDMSNEDHAKYLGEVLKQEKDEDLRALRAAKFDALCTGIVSAKDEAAIAKEDISPVYKGSWMVQLFEDFSIVKN